jgi:hypothetical protein
MKLFLNVLIIILLLFIVPTWMVITAGLIALIIHLNKVD